MRLLALVFALLTSSVAVAQEAAPQSNPPKQEALVGSSLDQSTWEPAMHPAARDEQRAANAAPSLPPAVSPTAATTPTGPSIDAGRDWSTIEISLTVGILVFTLIVLAMVVYLARKAQRPWSPQSILRVFGITLIIPLGIMLVVAGYSEKQIASVVGLLGVIAGYLLGNGERSRDSG